MYLFPTLVIKSVSQFMSHDYSNSTEVKSSERHGKKHPHFEIVHLATQELLNICVYGPEVG